MQYNIKFREWEVIETPGGHVLISTGDAHTADRITVPNRETARMIVDAHNASIQSPVEA